MVVVSGLGGGMSQASATGIYDGPWAVETQYLRISCKRVPNSMILSSKTGAALSGVTTRSYAIGSTALSVVVSWSVAKQKIQGSFATSSEEIKQKFAISPHTLDYANQTSFGEASAGILGTHATIDTSSYYYSRRPWTSTDVEFSDYGSGYNYITVSYSLGNLNDGTLGTKARGWHNGQYEAYASLLYGIDKLDPDTYKGVESMQATAPLWFDETEVDKIYVWDPLYELQGPYALTQENPTYPPILIDLIGNKIKSRQLIADYYNNDDVTGDTASIQIGSGCYTGSNYYDINRHDYT